MDENACLAWGAGLPVENIQWLFPKLGSASFADVLYTGIGILAAVGWVWGFG
jgi:hypothetical protein